MMASSSVSQEDFDPDYELSTRRSRIRMPRTRGGALGMVNRPVDTSGDYDHDHHHQHHHQHHHHHHHHQDGHADGGGGGLGGGDRPGGPTSGLRPTEVEGSSSSNLGIVGGGNDHDTSPKPTSRVKDKRTRPNHINKGKQQRDRRKLREKRRSTGVVHIPSTESTGGSTGEDEDDLLTQTGETRKNTLFNEGIDRDKNSNPPAEDRLPKSFNRRNKSPSDLDADDEDNQDYDSTVNQSDSTMSLHQETLMSRCRTTTNGRPDTPDTESLEELLERAREENKHLLELLAEKDRKIALLQDDISRLTRVLQTADVESNKLQEENKALLRAVSQMQLK